MAEANLILAIARGQSPPRIVRAIAAARSNVAQFTANNQLADERLLTVLSAASTIQSPNGVDMPSRSLFSVESVNPVLCTRTPEVSLPDRIYPRGENAYPFSIR